jgi:hypothetical protein
MLQSKHAQWTSSTDPCLRVGEAEDYSRHVEYCYINPVKHGLASRVRDWPFRRFIATWRPGYFQKTGRATSTQPVNLARHNGATHFACCTLRAGFEAAQ